MKSLNKEWLHSWSKNMKSIGRWWDCGRWGVVEAIVSLGVCAWGCNLLYVLSVLMGAPLFAPVHSEVNSYLLHRLPLPWSSDCQWVQELSLSQMTMAKLSETISKIILFSFEVGLLSMFVTVTEKQLRWWLRDMTFFIQHPGTNSSALYHQNSWYEAKVIKTPSPELCMSSYNSTFNVSQSSGHGNFATGKSMDEGPVCTWVVRGLLGSLWLPSATTGRHLGIPVVSLCLT